MGLTRWILLLGVLMATTVSAQTPVIGPTDAIAFDYGNADFTAYQVTRFEASWDGLTFGAVTTQSAVLADTPTGYTSYLVTPPFSNGTHTVSFRACNAAGCGGASSPFAFAYQGSPAGVPTNVRKVAR